MPWLTRSAFPRPSGNFAVGTTTLAIAPLAVAAAASAYDVTVWYPGEASGDRAPYGAGEAGLRSSLYRRLVRSHAARDVALAGSERFPIVVYVAGWGGRRTDNTILAEDLASNGFVVAAIGDPAFDRTPPAELAASADLTSGAAYERTLTRARERLAVLARRASAVLDELHALDGRGPGRFLGRLRTDRAGIAGFSFGGAVALEACSRDRRFAAAINIDGWLFGVRNERARPYFLIADNAPYPTRADLESEDAARRFASQLTVADRPVQEAALSHGGAELIVDGATHLDFTDAPSYAASRLYRRPAIEPKRMAHILARYVNAFLDTHVRGRMSPLLLAGATLDPAATLRLPIAERIASQGSAS